MSDREFTDAAQFRYPDWNDEAEINRLLAEGWTEIGMWDGHAHDTDELIGGPVLRAPNAERVDL